MSATSRAVPAASWTAIDQLCVNTIRFLAADAVEKAKSGHPGMPMGMADAAYLLWSRFLRWQPDDPEWPGRDRFVLSAGHGSMLLYSLLHLSGYDLPMEELQRFRQLGCRTPGHPEHGLTPGVETTTGPLGQGVGNARRHGARGAHAGGALSRWRLRSVSSARVRHLRRRRSDGGRLVRGGVARRTLGTRQPGDVVRRQSHHHRGRHRARVHRGRGGSASRPTAGTSSTRIRTTRPSSRAP